MRPTSYIFNHIAKTGGISLLTICRHNLEATEISPHLKDSEIHLMPTGRLEYHRLIVGHFSLLTQRGFSRNRYSMTLLRDPIRRIFSAYTYWRAVPEQSRVTAKAKDLPFPSFVRYFLDSPAIIANPYTHHFAALGRDFSGYPANASDLLAVAKYNLAAFDFVGISEDFERSARLLCDALDWRLPKAIPHENRSLSENNLGSIDKETMRLLLERNQLDLELYAHATTRFRTFASGVAKKAARPVEANRFVPFPIPCEPKRNANILSVSARWLSNGDVSLLELAVIFRINVPIAELSLVVQVNDADGKLVWGTSTSNENLALAYEAGRDCCRAFLVKCELPGGMYSVTAALSDLRRLGFHEHWIDRAALFEVLPAQAARSGNMHGMELADFRAIPIQHWFPVRVQSADHGGTGLGRPWIALLPRNIKSHLRRLRL